MDILDASGAIVDKLHDDGYDGDGDGDVDGDESNIAITMAKT